MVWQAGRGGHGGVRTGLAICGEAWQVGQGVARHGELRHGRHGEARLVQAGPGVDWRVMARFGRQGGVRRSKARHGEAGHGRQGMAGLGTVWLVRARQGLVWQGLAGVENAERRKPNGVSVQSALRESKRTDSRRRACTNREREGGVDAGACR